MLRLKGARHGKYKSKTLFSFSQFRKHRKVGDWFAHYSGSYAHRAVASDCLCAWRHRPAYEGMRVQSSFSEQRRLRCAAGKNANARICVAATIAQAIKTVGATDSGNSD